MHHKRLNKILQRMDPDLIHVDNLNSILRLKESTFDRPSIAIVRDLRFICPRQIIIAHTKKGPCKRCDFSCIKEQPFMIRKALKHVLRQNKRYRQKILKKYDMIITPSNFIRQKLNQEMALKIKVINDPISKVQKNFKKKAAPIKILYSGRLNKNKGYDLLIRVFSRLSKQFKHIILIFAGRGETEIKVPYHCKNRIIFKGFLNREEMHKQYSDADILVCPTRCPEGFGMIVPEAQSYGCVVLASRSGGFNETIQDGVNGFHFRPFDLNDLEDRLRYIIVNNDRLDNIRKNALRSAKKYTLDKISDRYYKTYMEFIETKK
jgi:glycosyltransferase involved in cell wall biosynthesis